MTGSDRPTAKFGTGQPFAPRSDLFRTFRCIFTNDCNVFHRNFIYSFKLDLLQRLLQALLRVLIPFLTTQGQHRTRFSISNMEHLPKKSRLAVRSSRMFIILILIQILVHSFTDYDLVRIHHPDSPSCRHLPPADRHSRFQAITAAYDSLRKGSTVSSHFDVYAEEVARRKRAYQRQNARRAQYAAPNRYQWNSNADDRWKDHLLIAIGVMVRALSSFGPCSSVVGCCAHRTFCRRSSSASRLGYSFTRSKCNNGIEML